MGSPKEEVGRFDDEIQHRVELAEGFWLAETACTQELWVAVMRENPSAFRDDPQNPVEGVSWRDISEIFLPKLNMLAPALQMELPTAAQWEYACRAGTTTPFSFGNQITTDQANYNGNHPYAGGKTGKYREKTVPVKALPANPWGLHQMHGNVWEWCVDDYTEYSKGTVKIHGTNQREKESRQRVLRGGSCYNPSGDCRSAFCVARAPDSRHHSFGFRLARRAC